MKKDVRVGIIGIGFGQHVLLPAFRLIKGIEVYGIGASSFERAKKVAHLHHIPKAYHSWQSMFADPDLDALAIAVPPGVQQDIVAAALLQNKHLFCEKPLGLCPSQTKQFALEADRRNLAHMIDFEFCAVPSWRASKNLIESGSLGKLKLGILNWQVETYIHRMRIDHWKVHPEKGGGVLLQFVSHVLFNLEWLCGPMEEIFMLRLPTSQIDTAVHGTIRFQSGLVFNMSVGNASYGGSGHWIEIYGEQGSFQLKNQAPDSVVGFDFIPRLKDKHSPTHIPSLAEVTGDDRIAAVTVLAERFVHWIQTGEKQQPSFHQGHRVNLLIQACQFSHERRSWVAVAD